MATDQDDGHEAQPGSTAYLLQEMQLYGYRPFEDEPDHRPLPDDRIAGGAVAEMFDALVSCLIDTRIEPDLEDLAWGVVNVFHRASERIERELDDNERSEEHTSELQSLMRISYAVFCLKTNNNLLNSLLRISMSQH